MQRPLIMSESTYNAILGRIRNHCLFSGQKSVTITFHGGEPCLIGPERFDRWCDKAIELISDIADIKFKLQTNGTLINEKWAHMLSKYSVQVGISIDGPKELNDKFRVDHKGKGSYDAVKKGIMILRNARIPFGILSVIPLGTDPISIHHHFLELGCDSISYLFPDFTHDTIGALRETYGLTPCADFLIPIFDDWWFNGTMDVHIGNFWNMARTILGGNSNVDSLGNAPLHYVMVETDGSIEGLDVLRICEEGVTKTGLNVQDAEFRDILHASKFHSQIIFKEVPLPQACLSCPEREICGGGYLPHRYSHEQGFDNPSVWCADLLKLFAHIRKRMGVTVEETRLRRQALFDISRNANKVNVK